MVSTFPPPAEPIRLFNSHENGPKSISEILRKTTRKPLYCHPKLWCDLHLDVLRVEGVDKEYPIDHVLGCPVVCDPSDTDLAEVMQQLSTSGGRFHNLMGYHVRTGEKTSRIIEEGTVAVCYGILNDLWQDIRRYPLVDTSSCGYEASIHSFVGSFVFICFFLHKCVLRYACITDNFLFTEAGPCIDIPSYTSPAKLGGNNTRYISEREKFWSTSPITKDIRTVFFPSSLFCAGTMMTIIPGKQRTCPT